MLGFALLVSNSIQVSNANGVNEINNGQWIDIKNTIINEQKAIRDLITNEDSYIKSFNPDNEDRFGWAVAVSGDTVVVGAYYEASDTTGVNTSNGSDNTINSGAVYVFVRDNNQWVQQAYIKPSHIDFEIDFGRSLAIDGNTLVVGSPGDNREATGINPPASNNNAPQSGAVYVFTRVGSTWSQQADIKPSNTKIGANFGHSIAIDGDTIIVGADGESSDGSDPLDESLSRSGAAYIYARTGNTWVEEDYLKASNLDEDDRFGWSVDVSGGTVIVGAFGEDSSGAQASNGSENAGAAYVFTRTGTNWSQQTYLKDRLLNENDKFGYSCAIDGDKIVIGAPEVDTMMDPNSGRIIFFTRTGSIWDNGQIISANNSGQVGFTVDMHEDLAIVGAHFLTIGASATANGGAAIVYQFETDHWVEKQIVSAYNPTEFDFFGYSVGISNNTIITGAPFEDSTSAGVFSADFGTGANNDDGSQVGAAYIYYYNDVIFKNNFED